MKQKVANLQNPIPQEIINILETLEKGGFEAYLVGGCVRDIFMGKTPKDWDITTNATPEQIIPLFPKTFYENTFGTVGVVHEQTQDETLKKDATRFAPAPIWRSSRTPGR